MVISTTESLSKSLRQFSAWLFFSSKPMLGIKSSSAGIKPRCHNT